MTGFSICIAIILYVCGMSVTMYILDGLIDNFPIQYTGSLFWPITVWVIIIISAIKYIKLKKND